jgi:hypothetical protein
MPGTIHTKHTTHPKHAVHVSKSGRKGPSAVHRTTGKIQHAVTVKKH